MSKIKYYRSFLNKKGTAMVEAKEDMLSISDCSETIQLEFDIDTYDYGAKCANTNAELTRREKQVTVSLNRRLAKVAILQKALDTIIENLNTEYNRYMVFVRTRREELKNEQLDG